MRCSSHTWQLWTQMVRHHLRHQLWKIFHCFVGKIFHDSSNQLSHNLQNTSTSQLWCLMEVSFWFKRTQLDLLGKTWFERNFENHFLLLINKAFSTDKCCLVVDVEKLEFWKSFKKTSIINSSQRSVWNCKWWCLEYFLEIKRRLALACK